MPAQAPAANAVAWPDLSTSSFKSSDGAGDAAVIVAIEDYAFLPDVPGAYRNGQDWYKYLTQSRGIPAEKVRLLVNQEAADFAIKVAVEEVTKMVQPGGRTWVVYIGHGAPNREGTDGLLVAADAQQTAAGIENRSVSQSSILQTLGTGSGVPVLVVDACYSGKRSDGATLVEGLQPTTVVKTNVPAGALVLTAGASDQYAGPLPGEQRPAFSYLLLGALRGWADDNRNGQVTADEAIAYTRSTLRALLSGSRMQTPGLQGEGGTILGTSFEAEPDLGSLVLGSKRPEEASPAANPVAPQASRQRVGHLRVAAKCGDNTQIELPESGLIVEDITEEAPSALQPQALSSRYDVAGKQRIYDPVQFQLPLGRRVVRVASSGCGAVEQEIDVRADRSVALEAALDDGSFFNRGNTANPVGPQVQLLAAQLGVGEFFGAALAAGWTRRWYRADASFSYTAGTAVYSENTDRDRHDNAAAQSWLGGDVSVMARLPLKAVALYMGPSIGYEIRKASGTDSYTNVPFDVDHGGLIFGWTTGIDVKFSCDWGVTLRGRLQQPNYEGARFGTVLLGVGPTWQPGNCTSGSSQSRIVPAN